jgi:hypothetical protein
MMNKVKQIFLTLIISFMSSLFIDGGKTIMFIGNSLQIHLNHDRHDVPEIPHQHNYKTGEDEKLLTLKSFDLSCSADKLIMPFYNSGLKLRDYSGLIWQPPKSL